LPRQASGPVTNQKGKQWQLIQAATNRSVEERRQGDLARPRRWHSYSKSGLPES
jgi:hypothetical protein